MGDVLQLQPLTIAPCSTLDCHNPGIRSRGCNVCSASLTSCAQHLISTFLNCVAVLGTETLRIQQSEVSALFAQTNIPALLQVASSLNNNLPCIIASSTKPMMGCCNYHIPLLFPSSGEKWIVRVPRPGFLNLHKTVDVEYEYQSEFATLKWLEKTNVPAPRAFGYDVASSKSNMVGITYLIMEFLEGRNFDPQTASPEEKKRVYDELAGIFVALSNNPLPKACSLVMSASKDGMEVPIPGKLASLRSKVTASFGPVDTAREYHLAVIDAHLDVIASGDLYSDSPVEAYLIYADLRAKFAAEAEGNQGRSPESFYLTHIDAKGDHVLLSSSGHITGIIDWQGARFAPFAEAFGPSLFTCDLHKMYSGKSGVTTHDKLLADALRKKGAASLSNAMSSNEQARRLHFGLGSARFKNEMWDLIRGLLVAFELYEGGEFEDWRSQALDRHKGDKRLEQLLARSA